MWLNEARSADNIHSTKAESPELKMIQVEQLSVAQ